MSTTNVIAVFGSTRPSESDPDYAEACELGRQLAARGFVVCSGGYGGVMEAVSRGAKEAGGQTIGVTAEFFKASANRWVDEEVRVHTWQERLFEIIRRGHGYVACRGGTGTLVELAVVWEMLNKGVMQGKPFAVLGEFWRPILERVREVETGHASSWCEAGQQLVYVAATPVDVAAYLAQWLGHPKPTVDR